MTDALRRYLGQVALLENIRRAHSGAESPEEESLLAEMDASWDELNATDRGELRRFRSDEHLGIDTDVLAFPGIPPRCPPIG